MKSAGDLSEDFDLNDYEQICFGNFDGYDPGTVLFRQRTPMVAPDGRRLKIYGLMDGSVQLVSELSVGPFDQFERSWTQNREPLVLPR